MRKFRFRRRRRLLDFVALFLGLFLRRHFTESLRQRHRAIFLFPGRRMSEFRGLGGRLVDARLRRRWRWGNFFGRGQNFGDPFGRINSKQVVDRVRSPDVSVSTGGHRGLFAQPRRNFGGRRSGFRFGKFLDGSVEVFDADTALAGLGSCLLRTLVGRLSSR